MTTVTLYTGGHFNGDRGDFSTDDGNLINNVRWFGTWNDVASSIVVTGGTARVYEHSDYNNPSLYLTEGSYNVDYLAARGFDNKISSIDLDV